MNPTSNQIQNKSLVSGATLTDALNTLRITSGGSGSGDMSRAVYDTDSDGKVDTAELADSVPWTGVTGKPSTFPPQTHSHTTTDVVGLDTALSGKASTSHNHTISDVTGLQTALDGKASSSHTHAIADVTNLQTTLDGKANLSGDNTFTGSVNYSGSAKRFQADFSNATVANRLMFQTSTANSVTTVSALPSGTATQSGFECYGNSDPTNATRGTVTMLSTEMRIGANITGTGTYVPMYFLTGGSFRLKLDTDGTFTSVSGAIGYGTGAGGTVTQATSKSTAVTLNKPNGTITMHNAALGAGASVTFLVNNSFAGSIDGIVLNQVVGYANFNSYEIKAEATFSGGFYITVKNIFGSSLSEALIISFKVIKGANA